MLWFTQLELFILKGTGDLVFNSEQRINDKVRHLTSLNKNYELLKKSIVGNSIITKRMYSLLSNEKHGLL